jgi:hypothetical protein
MTNEKYLHFSNPAQATTTIIPAGSDTLVFTAVKSGATGNTISVQIDSGVAAGTITVTGTDIVIGVGTGGDKGADDIATYYAVDAAGPNAARALATLAVSGTAHVAADYDSTVTYLSLGENSFVFPASSFAGMAPIDDTTLGVYFKSMYNFDGYDASSGAEVISDFVSLTIDSDHNHKGVMETICEAMNSPSGGYGFITVAQDASEDPVVDSSYIHEDITAVTISIASAVS